MIEHQIGAYTDCAHGAGLAVVSPAYYRYIAKYGTDKFVRFAKNVWGIDIGNAGKGAYAEAGIAALEDFIHLLKLPTTLRELGATEDMLPKIANSTVLGGGYKKMDENDIYNVLKKCF